MANPLPPAVHRDAHVQFDFAHLERRGVAVPHQVANQVPPLVGAVVVRVKGVTDAGSLHDGRVGSHVVSDANKPVVKDRKFVSQDSV